MRLSAILFGTRRQALLLAPLLLLGVPLAAPQVLAFPHVQQVGAHRVHAEMPITPALVAAIQEADRKVAAGPLANARPSNQAVFLTSGGWRWQWLSFPTGQALGVTRLVGENAVLNRTDPATATVHSDGPWASVRPVSEVVAHEMTHGSVRSHFGPLADLTYDRMLVEGLGDYVAGAGTLTDAWAEELLASGQEHPALLYWQGRKRVEAMMARPGMTVDRLFAEWTPDEGAR